MDTKALIDDLNKHLDFTRKEKGFTGREHKKNFEKIFGCSDSFYREIAKNGERIVAIETIKEKGVHIFSTDSGNKYFLKLLSLFLAVFSAGGGLKVATGHAEESEQCPIIYIM